MKTLTRIFLMMAVAGLFFACEKTDEFLDSEPMENALKDSNAGGVMVTIPFKADFMGTYMPGTGPCADCGPWNPAEGQFFGIVINEGGGNGTQLGKFTHYFEFCCNFMTGHYPLGYMYAYFVAANGDTLFVACEGQVLDGRLDHHPDDVNSYWMDPFVILGGTGRFKGATGSGFTNDYNRDSYPDNSFHHWRGTITMKKGKP